MTDPKAAASTDAQALAEQVRQAMLQGDEATRHMGIKITAIGPGTATATMTVGPHMVNGHRTCHGGFIATLADSAFAFACNAYNEVSVASGFDISFLAPGREGDVLTATAREVHKAGRTGLYDVDVCNQSGERLAVFRGRSYTMKGKPLIGN